MKEASDALIPLTSEQRELVQRNLGLVGVHLRRYVGNLAVSRNTREWDDLFQEGCLGLMRAAVAFRKERGIPFAAFALPRIRNAVSHALHSEFSMIKTPFRSTGGKGTNDAPQECRSRRPAVCSLSNGLETTIVNKRTDGVDPSPGETIGQRLRTKYERAVRRVGSLMAGQPSPRGDRDRLVRLLVEERFFVPREEDKRALRRIARDTQSSFARVAQCEKQLAGAVRAVLEADPEFNTLRQLARQDPRGRDTPIDREVEESLRGAGTDEYIHRYRRADPLHRGRMLYSVLRQSPDDAEQLLRSRFARLTDRTREHLLDDRPGPTCPRRESAVSHPG